MTRDIILASASKRRSEILRSCGIRHKVVVSRAAERSCPPQFIAKTVVKNAEEKSKRVSLRYPSSIIIGADTLVLMNSRVIGKPDSAGEARRLLMDFSGNRIAVFTGLCVIDPCSGKKAKGYAKSYIFVKKMKKNEVFRYFRALSPYDKAGGFSIEGVGSIIFDDIKGSYFNILGLPMKLLAELFYKIGLDIIDFIKI